MSHFELTLLAKSDLDEIILYRLERDGEEAAIDTGAALASAFERLAVFPGLGHLRSDLTSRPYFFYVVDPYLIVYARRVDPLPIIGIFHASRDIRRLLRKRARN